jgi:putative transposase
MLITDGGPENQIDLPDNIDHQVAQVDIHYSDSMIEAHNKIIKYNYLYIYNVNSRPERVRELLPGFIDSFNNRSHISLDGLTPNEAYSKVELNNNELRSYKRIASEKGRAYNHNHLCNHC